MNGRQYTQVYLETIELKLYTSTKIKLYNCALFWGNDYAERLHVCVCVLRVHAYFIQVYTKIWDQFR